MYHVVFEEPGQEPVLIASTSTEKRAIELASQVMNANRRVGPKVHVVKRDSADQLQVSQGGVALRDQPHLDPVGEAVTFHVPVARMGVNA